MVEKTKKHMKGSISEEDISTLLQRYTASTVLALLQEVAHCSDVKIDWNELVQNTSTGISDAREYQMLWRHVAYRHTLLDKLEDGGHPLDDDSDLEYEVEAFPTVSSEASAEAAACVKVLIASSLPSESSLPTSSIVEAPLAINIPNGLSSRPPSENSETTCSVQGMNITVPVSVQKQALPAVTPVDGLDANVSASGNMPSRRKRKPWSDAEDMELIAAVQKCGEGNWANILRGDFKGDRTASQLSQRWAIIRKRRGNLNLGSNSTDSQLSEAWRAAHHAMSLALDMPVKNITAVRPAGLNITNNSVLPTTTGEASMVAREFIRPHDQSQDGSIPTKSSPIGSLASLEKSQGSLIKPSTKPSIGSDSALRATAVAAGARIASPSDVASFIRATQAKNAVHIKSTGGSSTKASMPCGGSTYSETQTNVRYVCTSLETKPYLSCPPVTVASNVPHLGSVKACLPTVEHVSSAPAISSSMPSEQTNALSSSSLLTEFHAKQEVGNADEIKVSEPVYVPKAVQDDGACVSGNAPSEEVEEDKAPPLDKKELTERFNDVDNPSSSLNKKTAESNQKAVVDQWAEGRENMNENRLMGSPVTGDNQSAFEVNCQNQGTSEKQAELPTTVADGCGEQQEGDLTCAN